MYVIVGATGHTGSAVARKLLANNKKVRAIARHAGHLAPLTSKGAEAFVGNANDKDAIVRAFSGAEAVYLMFPPDQKNPDYSAYAKQLIEAYAAGIEKNEVKYAVTLSSLGADQMEKTGPVLGLRQLEERLNRIAGLNVLHLRAGYFMENTLGQADAIAQMGFTAGPLRADLKLPAIAAHDIGEYAGEALSRLAFSGHQVQELHGERDLSYAEMTAILGKAIGRPNLKYSQITPEQFRATLVRLGMSENVAGLLVELAEGFDSGHIKALEPRSARNTTPTSYETFVAETLLPLYQSKQAAA